MSGLGDFLYDVALRAEELDRHLPPFMSELEARDELGRRIGRLSKAINECDALETRRQLMTLMAQGCRMARDAGLLTEVDAVRQDDATLDGK